nr:DNA translocase FtsK [Coriobacterium glomerans]
MFAAISFIAVVSPANEPIAHAISNIYHMGFGVGAYVLPVGLLFVALIVFRRQSFSFSGRSLAGICLIYLFLSALLSLLVPDTQVSTAAMFEPSSLSTSGGLIGAFLASILQGALGKFISFVVVAGAAIMGLLLIGFSVRDFLVLAAGRFRELVSRRNIEVNESPWGDSSLSAGDDVDGGSAVDRAGDAAPTMLLSGRSAQGAVALGSYEDEPFVDVSDQLAEEHARTTLIPIAETYTDAASASAESPEAIRGDQSEQAKVLADGEDRQSQVPAFLLNPTRAARKAKRAAGTSRSRRTDATDETSENLAGRKLPPVSILRHNPRSATAASSDKELRQTSEGLQSTLNEFNLHALVVGWISGPTVTTFKVQPGEGERVSRISNLEDDIALSLAAQSVRIFAPIPGTSLVGIEIPNRKRQNVNLGDVLPYVKGGPLEFAIGRDAEGEPIVADLAKMPHLLIAGTTGSGKSVMINSIVMALLMRTVPEDVRLIMVDPKRVELAGYNGLPHLYVPVVTEPKQAASALHWAVSEMERRLKVFERLSVRKISTFNKKQRAGAFKKYDNPPQRMPYLVIIIDELSDLMMVAGKDVEASIVRIAQLGRAAGIHLIVATQRPSSNVVTGLIKANITNRIAFNVATGIDSRVIIDQVGAEKLTGCGDMLFSKVDWGKPKRIQGCFVSDDEINQAVAFVKDQGDPEYHEEILSEVAPASIGGMGGHELSEDDPLVWEAAKIVVDSQMGSTSGLQRRLKVGYARAGRIMDMLEEKGIVGPPDGSKPREVLLDAKDLEELRSVEARMADDGELGGF